MSCIACVTRNASYWRRIKALEPVRRAFVSVTPYECIMQNVYTVVLEKCLRLCSCSIHLFYNSLLVVTYCACKKDGFAASISIVCSETWLIMALQKSWYPSSSLVNDTWRHTAFRQDRLLCGFENHLTTGFYAGLQASFSSCFWILPKNW